MTLTPRESLRLDSVENVEDALTEPGQWFLDHSGARGTWTLTYLARPGENPNLGNVVIPQTAPPLVRTYNLRHVTFQGLTFAYDNYTVPDTGHPGRELELTSHRHYRSRIRNTSPSIQGRSSIFPAPASKYSPAFQQTAGNHRHSIRRLHGV